MQTFLIGIAMLIVGGFFYGKLCQKVFDPDDRETPAITKQDGMDYVPMPKWKNSLINLLNIAGTGPILGPIQGILFGPIAFITIPIGCVIGGAMHDYFCGMISMREGGAQMPQLIKSNTNKYVFRFYSVFVCLVLFLAGTVFVYTPGDIAATQLFGFSGNVDDITTWIIYGVIFVYYLIATLFPIDKIIGRVYPVFGAVLLFSAVGIFVMLFVNGYPMANIWETWSLKGLDFGEYIKSDHFIPSFFVTVACGILSGFHSTQITLVSRTVKNEREGRLTFYNMMIAEGFIAMVWAAGTMAMIGLGAENAGVTVQMTDAGWTFFVQASDGLKAISPTSVVGVICRSMLGPVGGIIAIIGVIILPVTSGDTAFRSLRLMIADTLGIKQDKRNKRVLLAAFIFSVAALVLVWAKMNPNSFNIVWRYFGWSNQTIAVFAMAAISIWFMKHNKTRYVWIPMLPFLFYTFVVTTYILSAKVGLNIPYDISLAIGGLLTVFIAVMTIYKGISKREKIEKKENKKKRKIVP